MANIKIALDYTIVDGQPLSFKAPCDCTAVTGIKVEYPDGESTTSTVFSFADAHGTELDGITNLFAEGAMVRVLLDTVSNKAYIQNADTNAYLEAQLASKAPAGFGLGGAKEISASEIDSTTRPGWYFCGESYEVNGVSTTRWWIFVKAYREGEHFATQELYTVYGSNLYKFERHRVQGNPWGAAVRCDPTVFAPAGYGLGANSGTLASDLNTCVHNGWYHTSEQTLNVPEKYKYLFYYASVLVYARTSKEIVQRLISAGHVTHSEMLRYTLDGGKTWTEEFVTPPLAVGAEYRTTERFYGEPVYAKLINFGAGPSSTKEVAIADYIGDLVRIDGYWYRDTRFFCEPFTSASFIDKVQVCQRSDNSVSPEKLYWALGVEVSKDCSSYKGIAVVYYTKRTV